MRRLLALVAACALVVVAAPASIADDDPRALPENLDCAGLPAERWLTGTVDLSTPVALDVLVLLDRVPHTGVAYAKDILRRAATAYAPMNITVRPTYRAVALDGVDAWSMLLQARKAVADAPEFDGVLTLTSVDMTNDGVDMAGHSYCIGGVRFREARQSFAVAEIDYGRRNVPDRSDAAQRRRSAIVVAHELGHLLGATHEMGNCAEAAGPEDTSTGDHWLTPCTIMDSLLFWSALRFGTVETRVIRGHAVGYARP